MRLASIDFERINGEWKSIMIARNHLIRSALMGLMLLFSAQSHALLITSATPTVENGDSAGCQADPACAGKTGTSAILVYLNGAIPDFGSELYKSDVDDGSTSESGPFDLYYDTTYSNSPSDPSDALIKWLEQEFMSDARYLLVKDGNHSPIWYLFDLATWDGMESITLQGFWPGKGAISHVSIYGGSSSRKIPEPATLALLGLGLFGMGLMGSRQIALTD